MKNLYFDIQAKVGISKHIYGLKGTRELCNLCRIDSTKTVLVIGSGNGASACKIVEIFGSEVVGVDIRPEMVKAAREYCHKKKANVAFIVGDALDLSFESDSFDAVISESVTGFVSDKKRAIEEFKRVTKKGGYIGLGEITWLDKPSGEIIDFTYDVMGGLRPESKAEWENLLRINQSFYEKASRLYDHVWCRDVCCEKVMWYRFLDNWLRKSSALKLTGIKEQELEQLPQQLRTPVVLRDVQGFSAEEAADILEISSPSFKVRLHRGRVLLRKHLEGYVQKPSVVQVPSR